MREVCSFLGHVGFYKRFIKDFSEIAFSLSNLIQKEVLFDFNDPCKETFNKLKQALTITPIIQPHNWSLPFELMCDASDVAIRAVLGQRKDRIFQAIYYASRTLDGAQRNYTTTEKEMLAVIFSFDKFRSYLIMSKVIVFTDHFAIKYLLAK